MDECPSHVDTVSLHVCPNLSSCSAERQPTHLQDCLCMAPKKGRGKGGGAARQAVQQAVRLQGLPQICPLGLQLSCMLVFIEKIAAAWELIHDHHGFPDIQTELPLAITKSRCLWYPASLRLRLIQKVYCKNWHLHSRHEHVGQTCNGAQRQVCH